MLLVVLYVLFAHFSALVGLIVSAVIAYRWSLEALERKPGFSVIGLGLAVVFSFLGFTVGPQLLETLLIELFTFSFLLYSFSTWFLIVLWFARKRFQSRNGWLQRSNNVIDGIIVLHVIAALPLLLVYGRILFDYLSALALGRHF